MFDANRIAERIARLGRHPGRRRRPGGQRSERLTLIDRKRLQQKCHESGFRPNNARVGHPRESLGPGGVTSDGHGSLLRGDDDDLIDRAPLSPPHSRR